MAPAGSDPAALRTHPGATRLGAAVAVTICAVIAALGWLEAPPAGSIVGLIGLPGASILAWRIAPRVLETSGRGAVAVALRLVVSSILIADAIVSVAIAAAMMLDGTATVFVGGGQTALPGIFTALFTGTALAIFLFILGAFFVGLLALIYVVPIALLWAGVVRWLAGHGWAR